MGRVAEKNAHQIKNTSIEQLPGAGGDESQYQRTQRSLSGTQSDTGAPTDSRSPPLQMQTSPLLNMQGSPYQIPATPSPFIYPEPDPCINGVPFALDLVGSGCSMVSMPGLSFGDFGADDGSGGYNCGDAAAAYGQALQYDPNTGTYMVSDYSNFMQYDPNCYDMMNQEQMQDGTGPEEHTQALLNALSEKLGDDQIQVCEDSMFEANNGVPMNGNCEDFVASGETEAWENQDCWEGGEGGWGHNGWNGATEDQQNGGGEGEQLRPGQRRAERREAREAARRQDRAANAAGMGNEARDGKVVSLWGPESTEKNGPSGNITTVMLRNIPNKYTREMLVKQLEHDMRTEFDFVYLPIDFKNKCNVGYAFINFRTVQSCDTFVSRFNGVEVRKCLPGLNSRKITEVTPARVQGFNDNVQRLRNSPVMRELVYKPEWMPLIFDENGEQQPFPSPERPLEPIKPRRRARDDEANYQH